MVDGSFYRMRVKTPVGMLLTPKEGLPGSFDNHSYILNLLRLEQMALDRGGDYAQGYRDEALAQLPAGMDKRLGEVVALVVNKEVQELSTHPEGDLARYITMLETERDGAYLPTFVIDDKVEPPSRVQVH